MREIDTSFLCSLPLFLLFDSVASLFFASVKTRGASFAEEKVIGEDNQGKRSDRRYLPILYPRGSGWFVYRAVQAISLMRSEGIYVEMTTHRRRRRRRKVVDVLSFFVFSKVLRELCRIDLEGRIEGRCHPSPSSSSFLLSLSVLFS